MTLVRARGKCMMRIGLRKRDRETVDDAVEAV